jgi:hypothetical protein
LHGTEFLTQRREDAKSQRSGFLCALKPLRLCVEKSAGGTPTLPSQPPALSQPMSGEVFSINIFPAHGVIFGPS